MALPGTILKVNNEGDQIGQLLIRSPTLGLGSTPHAPPGSYGANSAPGKASKCTYDGRATSLETTLKFTVMSSCHL